MRSAINRVLRRRLLERLPERRRLNKEERTHTSGQARVLENVLYRRAECLDDYGNMETLEGRVWRASRAVFFNILRRNLIGGEESERVRTDDVDDGDRESDGDEFDEASSEIEDRRGRRMQRSESIGVG